MQFTVLLDAPDQPAQQVQIAQLGDFTDSRYGDFSITPDEVDQWAQNLSLLPGGKALIDLDHLSDKPSPHRRTEAAGWITGIELADGIPKASVEWTPVGESAIREGRYRFFSPSFGTFKDPQGNAHDHVLTGGALTNKPFLTSMPQLQLASAENVDGALANLDQADETELLKMALSTLTAKQRDKLPASAFVYPDEERYPIPDIAHARNALARSAGKPEEAKVKAAVYRRYPELRKGADRQRTMELTADTLTALGLDQDADEQKLLDTFTELKERAETEPEPKSLEQAAKDDGKVLLDQGDFQALKDGAAAGIESKKQLDQLTLDTAFTRALDAGKAVAADREFYESLPLDVAVKRLEDAPQIVNVAPRGKNIDTAHLDAPANVQPDAFQLDQEVKAHMAEHNETDYVTALHKVEENRRVAA